MIMMNNVDFANSLLHILRNNECVMFKYIKKNGEMRSARGTLKRDVFERMGMGFEHYDSALAQVMNSTGDILVYWDLDKNGFRSCKVGNLIVCSVLANDGVISKKEKKEERGARVEGFSADDFFGGLEGMVNGGLFGTLGGGVARGESKGGNNNSQSFGGKVENGGGKSVISEESLRKLAELRVGLMKDKVDIDLLIKVYFMGVEKGVELARMGKL